MQAFARDPDGELPPADAAGQDQNKQPGAQRSEAEILLAITDLIAGGGALPGLFGELAPLLRELTDCEVVSFALYDSAQKRIVTHCWKKETETGPWKTALVEESPSGWVWQHQEALTIPDLAQETRFAGALSELRNLGVRSYAVLPMSTPKSRYGALGIGKGVPDAEVARDFLERIARWLALAVENRQIHREWQDQQNRLQSLVAISRELSSTLELEQLIPLVFANMHQITSYDHARLMLLEADGRTLEIRAVDPAQGAGSQLREGQRLPLANAICAHAMETRSVTFHDAKEMARHSDSAIDELRAAGVQSLCCVPLLMGSRALGTLDLGAIRETLLARKTANTCNKWPPRLQRRFITPANNAKSHRPRTA